MESSQGSEGTYVEEPKQQSRSITLTSDAVSKPIWSGTSLPSRVQKQVELCVRDSEIPNVGKGLFCMRDVKAGELIFKIKHPPMTIVSR
jgi:hypothetical protein